MLVKVESVLTRAIVCILFFADKLWMGIFESKSRRPLNSLFLNWNSFCPQGWLNNFTMFLKVRQNMFEIALLNMPLKCTYCLASWVERDGMPPALCCFLHSGSVASAPSTPRLTRYADHNWKTFALSRDGKPIRINSSVMAFRTWL